MEKCSKINRQVYLFIRDLSVHLLISNQNKIISPKWKGFNIVDLYDEKIHTIHSRQVTWKSLLKVSVSMSTSTDCQDGSVAKVKL